MATKQQWKHLFLKRACSCPQQLQLTWKGPLLCLPVWPASCTECCPKSHPWGWLLETLRACLKLGIFNGGKNLNSTQFIQLFQAWGVIAKWQEGLELCLKLELCLLTNELLWFFLLFCPWTLNNLCGVWFLFRSDEDVEIEACSEWFPTLIPRMLFFSKPNAMLLKTYFELQAPFKSIQQIFFLSFEVWKYLQLGHWLCQAILLGTEGSFGALTGNFEMTDFGHKSIFATLLSNLMLGWLWPADLLFAVRSRGENICFLCG